MQLNTIEESIRKRNAITLAYREALAGVPGITFLKDMDGVKHNYAYFPILVDEGMYGISRDELYSRLKENNIHGRRYFYPLISQFPSYKNLRSAKKKNLPVAHDIASKVLCLPIYPILNTIEIDRIYKIIKKYNKAV